jgi:hypothetical protein
MCLVFTKFGVSGHIFIKEIKSRRDVCGQTDGQAERRTEARTDMTKVTVEKVQICLKSVKNTGTIHMKT